MNNGFGEDAFAAFDEHSAAAAAGSSADAFEFSTEEVSEADLSSGSMIDMNGKYHLEVIKVEGKLETYDHENSREQTPHILLTLEVQETVKGQSPKGSIMFVRLWVGSAGGGPPKKGSIDILNRWAFGLGLAHWARGPRGNVLVNAVTKQPKIGVSLFLDHALGRQCIGPVKMQKDNRDNMQPEIPFGGVKRIGDPEWRHVPLNEEALIRGGYKPDSSGEGGAGAAVPSPAPQPTSPQASGGFNLAEM